jgi:hypothetical protein
MIKIAISRSGLQKGNTTNQLYNIYILYKDLSHFKLHTILTYPTKKKKKKKKIYPNNIFFTPGY